MKLLRALSAPWLRPLTRVPPRVQRLVHMSVVTFTGTFASIVFRGAIPTTTTEWKRDLVGAFSAAIAADIILWRTLAMKALSPSAPDPLPSDTPKVLP